MSYPAPRRLLGLAPLAIAAVFALPCALPAGEPPKPGGNIFDFGKDPASPRPDAPIPPPAAGPSKSDPSPATTGQPPAPPPKPADPGAAVVATAIQIVADDFVADIHLNGRPVPAENRHLRAEVFGAQYEKVTLDLRPGDWVVFNVVNNRLRWGGAYYFAAAVTTADGLTAFSSTSQNGDWSACDDLAQAARFVADPAHGRDRKPQVIDPAKRFDRGDREIAKIAPDFDGEPIWGDPAARSTWIKFVVPNGPADRAAKGGL